MIFNFSSLKFKIIYILNDSLLKNSFHLISSSFASSAFGFMFWMAVARFYTSSELGLAAGIISSMNLVALFSFLGLNISIIRFLPRSTEKEDIINSSFTLSLIAALITSSLFIIGIDFWSPTMIFLKENLFYALTFILFLGFWVIAVLMDCIFIACRISKYVLLKEVIFSAVKMPLPVLFAPFSAFGVFLSWIIGALISMIYGLKILYKIIPNYRPRPLLKRKILRDMFSFSFLNYMANFFNVMPGLVLPIMLANMISPREAAYFYTSWTLSSLLFLIPKQMSQSLLAEGSNFLEGFDAYIARTLKVLSLILIPSVFFIYILGDKLLLVYGSEYSWQGFDLLRILAFSSIPLAFCSVYTTVKNIESEVGKVIIINAAIAAITLTGSYFLVSKIGLIGVGYAWMIANSIAALCIGFSLIKKFYM